VREGAFFGRSGRDWAGEAQAGRVNCASRMREQDARDRMREQGAQVGASRALAGATWGWQQG
jgi:hypothetical protein